MSVVGPRPLLVRYLPYYTSNEKKRHDVRPGLTGLAQINGRNNLNWDQRLMMDIQYIEDLTFYGDMKIVFLTIGRVLKRENIAVGESLYLQDLDEERMYANRN